MLANIEYGPTLFLSFLRWTTVVSQNRCILTTPPAFFSLSFACFIWIYFLLVVGHFDCCLLPWSEFIDDHCLFPDLLANSWSINPRVGVEAHRKFTVLQSLHELWLCGWAHHHDVCVCPLSKSCSSQTKPLLHLYPAETLPLRPKVSFYKTFPGLSDNDFTPSLLVSSLIPLKINPLQNCPAHAIIVAGCFFFFFVSISNYPKKLCLWHHIIQVEVWMGGGWEKENLGGLNKHCEVIWYPLTFANFYISETRSLRLSFYTWVFVTHRWGDTRIETRGRGLSFDCAGNQCDSGHACCCGEHRGTMSVCSHGSRPVENEEQCRQGDSAL